VPFEVVLMSAADWCGVLIKSTFREQLLRPLCPATYLVGKWDSFQPAHTLVEIQSMMMRSCNVIGMGDLNSISRSCSGDYQGRMGCLLLALYIRCELILRTIPFTL